MARRSWAASQVGPPGAGLALLEGAGAGDGSAPPWQALRTRAVRTHAQVLLGLRDAWTRVGPSGALVGPLLQLRSIKPDDAIAEAQVRNLVRANKSENGLRGNRKPTSDFGHGQHPFLVGFVTHTSSVLDPRGDRAIVSHLRLQYVFTPSSCCLCGETTSKCRIVRRRGNVPLLEG